ncbi:MAG: lipid II:glycine glycyltransferase FemX, partial [Anaerolineales bacterium]
MDLNLTLTQLTDPPQWDARLHSLPAPQLMQSWTWGELKSRFGWAPFRFAWTDPAGAARGAAQLLFRTERGLTLAYCPKGPVV